jgi:hypothetical protein
MIVRIITLLLLMACVRPLLADEENTPAPTPTPGIFHRIIHIFHKDNGGDPKAKEKKLELTLDFTPQPVKLSAGKEIQVTLVLTNKTGKFVRLDFPTTQRFEVVLRNQAGKLLTQWSEEQSFANNPGYVTLDPNEHVQYALAISGRDLVAGRTYTIEGFFPNYENLRVARDFVPQN